MSDNTIKIYAFPSVEKSSSYKAFFSLANLIKSAAIFFPLQCDATPDKRPTGNNAIAGIVLASTITMNGQ